MNVLVTRDTSGFGSRIVNALSRAGHHVIVFARRAARSKHSRRQFDRDVGGAAPFTAAARLPRIFPR